ncbi:MAG: hypothetical protein ABJH08_10770 [Balneola sp.]
MNKFPLIEILVFFCRHSRLPKPIWRKEFTHQLKRVRSCHSKSVGGIKKSFYSIETMDGQIFELEFDQEELLWSLIQCEAQKGLVIDRVLVHVKRHKHQPSDAHRMIPIRFEIFPKEIIERATPIEFALIDRLRPYRFKRGKHGSIQVSRIETSHMENTMITKHLHFVAEDTEQRFYHLVYTLDQLDWRFMQEVDREFLFVR